MGQLARIIINHGDQMDRDMREWARKMLKVLGEVPEGVPEADIREIERAVALALFHPQ